MEDVSMLLLVKKH